MTGNSAEGIALELFRLWREALSARAVEEMVALYSDQALFLGSNPVLLRGKAGVRSYFTKNLGGTARSMTAEFGELAVEYLPNGGINVAAIATFAVDGATTALRITLNLVLEEGGWKIACHHVSQPLDLS